MWNFERWIMQWPRWIQYSLALFLIGCSMWMTAHGTVWYWGWIFGLILLWFACFGRRPQEGSAQAEESDDE